MCVWGGGKNKGGGRETDADTEISSSRNSRAPGSPVESQPHPEGAGTGMGGGGGGVLHGTNLLFLPQAEIFNIQYIPFLFQQDKVGSRPLQASVCHAWVDGETKEARGVAEEPSAPQGGQSEGAQDDTSPCPLCTVTEPCSSTPRMLRARSQAH